MGRYYGAIPVAVYGIAAQLNSYYLNLSTAISNVYIPRVNRIIATGSDNMHTELTNIFISIGRVQFIIIGFILSEIVVVGREFLGFWAGKDYYAAYPILLVLVIPVTIPLIQNIGIAMQQAMNKHVFRSILYFLIALANVIMSIFLVQRWGGIGAAMATAISLIIGNGILMNWYYSAKIHLDVLKFWRIMLHNAPSIIVSIVVGFLWKNVINSYRPLGFLVIGIVVALTYALVLWLFVITKAEKKKIISKLFR